MPETPPNDDQFADLFSSLPTAASRGSDGAAASAPPPGSRRAARAAQEQASPAAATPATPAATVSTPGASGSTPAASAAESSAARATTQTLAPPSLDALFAAESHEEERHRVDRHRRDRRKSRIAGWVVFFVILGILGAIAAGGFYVWNTYEDKIRAFVGWEEPRDYEEGIAEGEVSITIVSGDNGSTISRTLHEAGVTKTSSAFYDYLIATAQNPTFQPGVYSLQKKMTSAAALTALEDPANRREYTAQLPEGLTEEQILPRLSEGIGIPLEDFQAAVADPSVYGVPAESLEGWLFPATYTFDPGVTAQQVIQTLVDRAVSSLDAAGVPVERRQEILTIASIIQREGHTDDFDKVSRVIQNRLNPSNPETNGYLQMDSTVQYGYGEMHDGTASSSKEALEDDNAWNTYKHPGRPKGPIANPGDAAIDAAMHPADGTWLYFVTWNMDTGETIFSTTYAEHEQAIEKWHDWCAANDNRGC